MTSHLEEGTLHELLDGEIPSAELPPIQAHLAGCADCRARLEEAREFQSASDGLLEVLDQSEAHAPGKRVPAIGGVGSRWTRNLAWAATIVIAVGVGYYGRGGSTRLTRQEAAKVSAVALEPAVAPAESQISTPPPAEARPEQAMANQPALQDAAGARALAGKAAAAESKVERGEFRSSDEAAPRTETAAAPQPATVPATPAAPAAGAAEPRSDFARLNEVVVTGALTAQRAMAKVSAAPDTILFPEAIRRLNGSLRLIEGLIPDRFEAIGQEVRVVYSLTNGELRLTQQLINGRIAYRLTAPPGFPADSLQRLRLRIRE